MGLLCDSHHHLFMNMVLWSPIFIRKLYNKHHTLEVSSFHGVFVWQSSYLSKFFWNEHALSDLPFFEEFHLFIGPLCDKYISHLLQFFSSWTCFLWSSKALFPRKLHNKYHTLGVSSFHESFVWHDRMKFKGILSLENDQYVDWKLFLWNIIPQISQLFS